MSVLPMRAAAGVAAALLASAVFAAGPSGADLAKARQSHMKGLGEAAKLLVEQMRSGAPDKAQVKVQSDKIAAAGRELSTWFPVGSGLESGVKTRALPAIWSDPAGFSAVANRFAEQSAKLGQLADAGDLAGVGGQIGAVGGACKGCHDKFRAPEK